MKHEELKTLHALADAKYKARQQLFMQLMQRETAIRAELSRLQDQARNTGDVSDQGMRTIGADVIWKAWLGRAQKSLNMKLALVLAEKEQHVRQVRQAYGKVLATDALLKVTTDAVKEKTRRAALDQAIEMSLVANPKQNR